ncbi:hypothetical protein EFA46_013110 (plasmid) [Halarchaeum sp. CBA1220]|uniref:SHOCT domain-containing protein n=1 Tax=Halarchaeum sp. CBA1220 TaxID=1853682 RepID=UPI000F3A8D39|nr:hypothetical protein [Halarchaeum sp. CBA1220]QLC35184.1 hypothetical protein EFA46_013110 [Halarchaeum sp. CBA1220]
MADTRSTDGMLRSLLLVLAVIVVAPLLAMAVPMMGLYGGMMGGAGGSGGMMGAYGGMMGGYSPLWGIGIALVPLVVLAALAYVAYRTLAGRQAAGSVDPALAELRLAYARGDLSDEEYASRRETLREDDGRE